ncbi:metal-dependent transcriptional regulator [Niabella beijingensis]|uniref:metal-dependent transcriptional regulator n=1 Tax=Niabella beijingensis TaxID=2872700 RepID=UPI001CBD1EBE|nr:metal-dependent transcriptional regulator [Niabella beijingensis]MBZ4190983.1 metal-dependent transcriptional regulator [Niabella beijingensis]
MTLNLSPTEENYIKAVYHLEREGQTVTTNHLSEFLKTAAASVTDMLKKLKQKKLVHYRAYYGCNLTDNGRKQALMIIRRHRLWEYFLSKKLGFSWNEVHDIAEELEHVGSTSLINKLDAFLGYPRFDPHGDPIPDEEGHIIKTQHRLLSEVPAHTPVEVVQIGDQSATILEILSEKNIRIGTLIEIRKRFSYDQSLEIRAGSKHITQISKELSRNILVKDHE